jgi:hypothetical protein
MLQTIFCSCWNSGWSKRVVNPERIEGPAFALAGRSAVNADGAANAADMQGGGRIELAALAAAVRAAVTAGVGVVRVIMESCRANPATVAVTGGVAVDALILRLRLEETDSLRSGEGHGDAIITAIYIVASRFFGQKRA